MIRLVSGIAFILFSSLAAAAAYPPRVSPIERPYGVCAYYEGSANYCENNTAPLADAGVGLIREDFPWTSVEKERGVYTVTGKDTFLDSTERHGVWALIIFDYDNPLYPKITDNEPAFIEGFSNYAAAVARHLAGGGPPRGRRVIYEIWNEENGPWRVDPVPYVHLVAATARRVREVDPNALICSGGVAWVDRGYLQEIADAGIMEHVDFLGFHPYWRGLPENDLDQDIAWMRALIAAHNRTGRKIDVLSTECGYAVNPKEPLHYKDDLGRAVSLDQPHPVVQTEAMQAAYFARMMLAHIRNRVEGIVWFKQQDWQDDGWGLLRSDGSPRPAFEALRGLSRLLARNPKELLKPPFEVKASAPNVTCDSYWLAQARAPECGAGRRMLDGDRLVIALWTPTNAYVPRARPVDLTIASDRFGMPRMYDLLDPRHVGRLLRAQRVAGRLVIPNLAVGPMPVMLELRQNPRRSDGNG